MWCLFVYKNMHVGEGVRVIVIARRQSDMAECHAVTLQMTLSEATSSMKEQCLATTVSWYKH